MDAFYASVEQRDDASLRGRPVVVGGQPTQRGVVAAASYEARAYGVRSAMPMARAVRLCPELVIVRPDFSRYRAVSQQVFEIFRSVTPLVEGLSLDEAYLDVTENTWGERLGVNVARRIKDAILDATQLTASAGVAPNKFLAKIASGWQKPDGLTVIAPERVESFLQKLPVDALWGVGPVTARRLKGIGITRLVEVRTADPEAMRKAVGSQYEWLHQLAQGIDARPVEPHRESKSAGTERTFAEDLVAAEDVRARIEAMARSCAQWLARHELYARTVTVKIRYGDFTTITRSHSAPVATRDEAVIVDRALGLLARTDVGARAVRLAGVSVQGLQDGPGGDVERDDPAPWLPFD